MVDFLPAREMMVDCQIRPADVTRYALIEAMLWAPREMFVPRSRRDIAYADAEIPLGGGRALLAPRTLAKMIDAAEIGHDALVLDVAPGTGYSTAVLSKLAAAVIAVEPDETLAGQAAEVLATLSLDNVIVEHGPAAEGHAAHGPYDAILINGGVEQVPASLTDQLKVGGRLVTIRLDGAAGQCRVMLKTEGGLSDRLAFDATAPLLAEFARPPEFAF